MTQTVKCPTCEKAYHVADQSLGGRAKCKHCGATFTLTLATAETSAKPPPTQPAHSSSGSAPAAAPASAEPKKIGRYLVRKKLGAGGMGIVWLAHDPGLNRDVALKTLPAAFSADQERLKRFLREARAAAKLDHPHTVAVYEAGVDAGVVFIAMELIDGGALSDLAGKGKTLNWRAATRAIRDAAAGLAAAHEAGLIHRDVKPANLLRTTSGAVKVVDFGLARAHCDTTLTREGALLGTPDYMAPEAWIGGQTDARSDVYSLICTYYFLLTGGPPFVAANIPALGYQHRHAAFPDARQAVPDLPPAVSRILARGSQKEPADRYPSGTELLADLEAVTATLDQPASHGARRTALAPRRRSSGGFFQDLAQRIPARLRRPWWAWIGAAAVVLCVVSILGYWAIFAGKSPAMRLAVNTAAPAAGAARKDAETPPAGSASAKTAAPPGAAPSGTASSGTGSVRGNAFAAVLSDSPINRPSETAAKGFTGPAAKASPQPMAAVRSAAPSAAAAKAPPPPPPATAAAPAAVSPPLAAGTTSGTLSGGTATQTKTGPSRKPKTKNSGAAQAAKRTPPKTLKRPAMPAKATMVASEVKPSGEDPEEVLLQVLAQKAELDVKEKPLCDTLLSLGEQQHTALCLDRRALADVGVATDTPVTFTAKGISLDALLTQMLNPLSLTWALRNEVILITSKERRDSLMSPKVYALSGSGPAVGTPVAIMPGPNNSYRDGNADQLIDAITTVVSPASWDHVGGPGSCAFGSPGGSNVLAVSQTLDVHRQLEAFLRQRGLLAAGAKSTRAKPPAKAGAAGKSKPGGKTTVEAPLDQKYTCEFVEAPLSGAAQLIQDVSHVVLQLDRKALDDVGVSFDRPITFQAKDLSLKSLLTLLLHDLDLTWLPQEGSLLITTPEMADTRQTIQSYAVADLVGPAVVFANRASRIVYSDYEYLVDMITSTVAPTSWDRVGGPGSITLVNTPSGMTLAVRQRYDIQGQIVKLLNELRQAIPRNVGKRR